MCKKAKLRGVRPALRLTSPKLTEAFLAPDAEATPAQYFNHVVTARKNHARNNVQLLEPFIFSLTHNRDFRKPFPE